MRPISPRPTTLIEVTNLLPGSEVRLIIASETFQHTGSFKFRAAYQVAKNAPHGHIIAASSGNFGQALALACKIFDKKCTVVMPHTSAQVKVDAVRSHGGMVDLIDVQEVSRDNRIEQLAQENPDAYISSAFDDPWVIAGNATLGAEILDRCPGVETIVAPVGGGGLASGLVMAVKDDNRQIKVVGAEPLAANDAARSFQAGHLISNETEPQTIADGARTRSLGKRNWEILHDQGGLSEIVEVSEAAIVDTVRLLFLNANLKVEPTGALAVAGVVSNPDRFNESGLVCCIVSGGNVDPMVYAKIIG